MIYYKGKKIRIKTSYKLYKLKKNKKKFMKNITKNLMISALVFALLFAWASPIQATASLGGSVSVTKGDVVPTPPVKVPSSSSGSISSTRGSLNINTQPPPIALQKPTVADTSFTIVDSSSVTLSGSVNPNGFDTDAWFHRGAPINPPLGYQNIGSGTTPVILTSYTLTGLIAGTTYNFRIEATNQNGTTYGPWTSFTTPSNCLTPAITSISPSSILVGSPTTIVSITGTNFNIGSLAMYNNSSRGTSYNSTTSIDIVLLASDLTSTGNKSITVTNGSGCTSNEATLNVYSSSGGGGGGGGGGGYLYPYVSTNSVTAVSNNTATLSGTITRSNVNVSVWFEYGTSSNLAGAITTLHSNPGYSQYSLPISQNVSGLSPKTVYYFRIVGNSPSGIITGNILSFTTTGSIVNPPPGGGNGSGSGSGSGIVYEIPENSDTNTILPTGTYYPENGFHSLAASALYGFMGFLPNTILGWIFLLILILAIVILARELYLDYTHKKSLGKVNASHIENLPT